MNQTTKQAFLEIQQNHNRKQTNKKKFLNQICSWKHWNYKNQIEKEKKWNKPGGEMGAHATEKLVKIETFLWIEFVDENPLIESKKADWKKLRRSEDFRERKRKWRILRL
jgi:hypothetical protein